MSPAVAEPLNLPGFSDVIAHRLLLLVPIAVGLHRSRRGRGCRQNLRLHDQLQARHARRSVRRDGWLAAGETSSGAPALPPDRVAALAREARAFVFAAPEALAVRSQAIRRHGACCDRGRSQRRAVHAPRIQEHLGEGSQSRRPRYPGSACGCLRPAGDDSCSIGRDLPKSPKPTSGTARTRSPLVCSARPDSSSMANHSGGRIESSCWRMR